MNDRAKSQLLSHLDAFEASSEVAVEDIQAQLQQALAVWEGSTASDEFAAIDRAENALEEILHARLLQQQRPDAIDQVRVLRSQLSSAV